MSILTESKSVNKKSKWFRLFRRKQEQASTGVTLKPLHRELEEFLDHANLKVPQKCLDILLDKVRRQYTPEQATEFEERLRRTNYRELMEQLFGVEVLSFSHMHSEIPKFQSAMCIGKLEMEILERKKMDLHDLVRPKLEITHAFLSEALPDSYFATPPKRICEIGGAWGGTIKHLKERFNPEVYHNYEPDIDYSRWAEKHLGVTAMPVDGETLSGTETDSMDIVIANNVLQFLPVIKIWSYMQEMKRVIRKDGIVMFNAIISTHLDEQLLNDYLHHFFPKRSLAILPGDLIFKCFTPEQFEVLKIIDKEYYILRRNH